MERVGNWKVVVNKKWGKKVIKTGKIETNEREREKQKQKKNDL